MPYPNEHAARVKDPGEFDAKTFRRKDLGKGVSIILGKLKSGGDSMVTQAYRFDKTKFTAAEAKKWLADHEVKGAGFEAAKDAEKEIAEQTEGEMETKDIEASKCVCEEAKPAIVPVEIVAIDTTPPPAPPTTFSEVDQIEAAKESAHEIDELNCTFGMLTQNIMQSKKPEEIGPAMIALATEYQSKITEAMKPEAEKSLVDKALGAVAEFGGRVQSALGLGKKSDNGVMFYKDTETGSLRWLGVYSNKFQDRDNPPEIISSEAHKEFAAAVEKGEWPMPELRLWHIASPIGVADTIAWDDSGFMLASGTITKGLEPIAEAMQQTKFNWLMSHGMPREEVKYDENDPSIIVRYRSKEVSALPEWAAANALTLFDLAPEGGVTMPFSDGDKNKLTKVFGKDRVETIENLLASTATQATADGVKSKEAATPQPEQKQETTTSDPATTEKPAADPATEPVAPVADQAPDAAEKPVAEFVTRAEAAEAIAPIAQAVASLTAVVKELNEKLSAQNEAEKVKAQASLRLSPSASLGELIAQSITGGHPAEALVKGREATLPKETQAVTAPGDSGVMQIPFLKKLLTSTGESNQAQG